jgi:hypothetical protein
MARLTGPAGQFEAEVRPTGHRRLRARFAGRGDLRASSSRVSLLRVRAVVGLVRPATRGSAGRPVRIRGKVAPLRRRVYLVLDRRRATGWRRVGVGLVRARRGRFAAAFVPAVRGLYRFTVVAKAGVGSDRGASRPQRVLVR